MQNSCALSTHYKKQTDRNYKKLTKTGSSGHNSNQKWYLPLTHTEVQRHLPQRSVSNNFFPLIIVTGTNRQPVQSLNFSQNLLHYQKLYLPKQLWNVCLLWLFHLKDGRSRTVHIFLWKSDFLNKWATFNTLINYSFIITALNWD